EMAPPPPVSSDLPGTRSEPIAAGEALSYSGRLEDGPPPAENLRSANEPEPPPAKAERAAPASPAPSPAVAAPAAAAPAVSAAPAEPGGGGLAIQVAAVKERVDADRIANRLIGKGYKAYVVTPAAGTPPVYRVRVGKFKEQREADSVAARLKKEEQFSPWIVR
ncbi:MAG: SPOR domain-containing protein, partial [Vicinamibacterales bacterium]